MELTAEWSDFSDLTLMEGAFLLTGIDPKEHARRREWDDEYAYHFYERDVMTDVWAKCAALLSAAYAKDIATTVTHTLENGELDPERTRLKLSPFVDWCRNHGYRLLADALSASTSPTNSETSDESRPAKDDWIASARAFADREGQKRWARGERQITARGVSEAVAQELEKTPAFWGKRGPRSASNVRTEALRSWKFTPAEPV